jgi:uncharacterized RDD family membrane protein YckC
MSITLPSLREQGIQALRDGDLDQAIEVFTHALIAERRDAEAQMFLGVAYSQKGLHAQAKRALQTAVDLRPQEARWHFNLGVALEAAGDASGAVSAYRCAVQIDPEQAQARERLQRMNAATDSPLTGVAHPAGSGNSAPPREPRWAAGGSASDPAPAAGPAGTVPCEQYRQWSKQGLSCEVCSAPLRLPPAPGAAPWLQGAYLSASGQLAPGGASWTTAPGMSTGEALGRRFAAEFIDGILFAIVNQLALWITIGHAAGSAGGTPSPGELISTLLPAMSLSFILYFAYYCGMLGLCGQTLGKMALGVRVVAADGGNPSLWVAFLREIVGKTVSGIPLSLGYFWMLWDGEQQTWHDKIAGTHVERA